MDSELSKQYFDQQVSRLLSVRNIVEHHGWVIKAEGFDIYVAMHPKRHPEKNFLARLRCTEYPQRAPSFQFVHPSTRQEGAQNWPQGNTFQAAVSRSSNLPQLCIPGIREFHEGCHANDSSKPWSHEKYSFARILEDVQAELDRVYS